MRDKCHADSDEPKKTCAEKSLYLTIKNPLNQILQEFCSNPGDRYEDYQKRNKASEKELEGIMIHLRVNLIRCLENKIVQNNVILDDLKECPGALWHLFLAAENRELKNNEWNLINEFLNRVRNGLIQALEYMMDYPLNSSWWNLLGHLPSSTDQRGS